MNDHSEHAAPAVLAHGMAQREFVAAATSQPQDATGNVIAQWS